MTPPVECIGDAENRRQLAHRLALHGRKLREVVMFSRGQRLAIVACDVGDDRDLVSGESAQSGMADQVIRMFVVPLK